MDARNSVVKELKGQTASLTWTIIKSSGETIVSGGINFVRPGEVNTVAVAFIGQNNAVTVLSPYSDRGWTASFTSQNLILSAKNLKEEDDARYTLSLFHQTGGKVESKSKTIRLKVLGKLTLSQHFFYIICLCNICHYCMVHCTYINVWYIGLLAMNWRLSRCCADINFQRDWQLLYCRLLAGSIQSKQWPIEFLYMLYISTSELL